MKSFFKILSAALLLCAFAASCGSDSTEPDPEPAPNPSGPVQDDKEEPIVLPEGTDLSPILSQDGESKIVRFTAKQSWQAYADDTRAASDWLHLSPTSGGAGAAEMTITADPNKTPDDRTGYVKIVSGNSQITFDVTQKQRDALTVSPSKRTIDAPETEFEIEVRANIDFKVEVQAEWIEQISTRALTTTVLHFRAKRNVGDERTGTIVIRSGEKSETITITQEKGEFIVDTGEFHIDAAAQSVSANVRANIDFEVKPQAAWIHYNPTRAMTSYTLTFDIDENTTGKERTGEITVSSGGKSETIKVIQSDVAFDVAFDQTEVSKEGGIITATVNSNLEYVVVLPDGIDWLTSADTRAITTKKHHFKIEANPNLETRSAIIQFVYQSEKGEAIKQVTITQQAAGIHADPSLYELDAYGGQVEVSVQGNTASSSDIQYAITQGAEWISRIETRAVTAHFTFQVDKNTTGEPREGEITFTLPDKASAKVRIVQSATAVDDTDIINFPDANFKAYLVANFDLNKDGEISQYEASLITEIRCENMSIQSLEGIEYCTSLTYLNCYINQLTTLDVSKNTALTYLLCDGNQLTTLNASGCSALTYLNCNHNHQLTSLNVSGCSALKELWCGDSQLTTLDVSECSALKELVCASNRLTSLDVSKNASLKSLVCSVNQLTTLDVSGYTTLEKLQCNDNQLTALDVRGCSALTELICYSNQLTTLDTNGCPVLKDLTCSDNPLEVLNLGEANPSVFIGLEGLGSSTKLKVIGTKITGLDVWKTKLQSLDVSGCPALTSLGCVENQLTSLDVSGCSALTDLECAANQLTTLDVSGCSALTKLTCWNNQLTTLDVSNNTALRSLNCCYNQLTTLDVSGCSALKELGCYNNQLTALDVSNNTALTSLSCDSNKLTTLDVSKNTFLRTLQCYNNQLTSLDVSKTNLGNSTERNPLNCSAMPTLQTLYLKTGWEINGINKNRSTDCIPSQTEILYKD